MMKLNFQNLKETDNGYFWNDRRITDFTMTAEKITKSDGMNFAYRFCIKMGCKKYWATVTLSELSRSKFLQRFPVYIEDERVFYGELRRSVLCTVFTADDIRYQTNCNGLQKVNGEYMFVFTNGSIGQDGFHEEIFSGIGQMYLPPEAVQSVEESKETIQNLFKQFNRNPRVFYPLFFINLMAITNGFYRTIGENDFMKITLWLDGKSGSGKTELAKAVGTYVFGDKDWQKCPVYATGRRKQILQSLSCSSGSVFILDDVKNERVRDRKNSVLNIVDDCIRSVFQGRLTENLNKETGQDWIDCCAIITGEYMDTEESQNARIFLLKSNGFLDDEKNSAALRILQENSMWMSSVCCSYIQWFLGMVKESSFPQFLKEKLKEMRSREKLYQSVSNAERLNENRHMIEMAAVLAKKYFSDLGMEKGFLEKFSNNASASIKAVTDDTFILLGAEQMISHKAMERLFETCKIRNASYKKTDFYYDEYKYNQKYFCIDEEEDFVWISDYKKSLLKSNEGEHELFDENPCLIICASRFEHLFKAEVQQLSEEMGLASAIVDNLMSNWSRKLRKMQIIYKKKRTDDQWGRPAMKYPVYELKENINYHSYEEYYENDTRYSKRMDVYYTPVIQINTKLPCVEILKERMNNEEYEEEDREKWAMGEPVGEIIRKRKDFINEKSLYKE